MQIIEATTTTHYIDLRNLLMEYGQLRSNDAALGDYEQELEHLPGEYGRPDGCLILAYEKEQLLGCVAYRKIAEGICEMKRMFVSQREQGKGMGKALGQRIINEAVDAGYRLMRLDTHPWMKTAQHIYTQLGFIETERYNNNPTPGIRFFELKLT